MASSYVPGLTPTFRTPAASSYVPGLTPSLQTPAANDFGLSPEALQKLQAEMAAWDPKKMVAPGNFTGQPSASQQRVNAYIAEQAKQGNELIYKPAGMNPWENAIGMGDTTNYDEFDPNNPSPNMLPVFRFTTGTRSLGSSSPSGNAPTVLKPGETYTLTDYDGKTLATANTPEQMRALLALSEERGSSGWKLFSDKGTYSQPGTDPTDPRNAVHSRSPADNTLAYIAGAGLAAMGGAAALGIGAGGGAGSLGSITGASAANAVLPGLAGSVAPVAGGVGGAAITGAGGLAGLGAAAAPGIVVTAPVAGGFSAGAIGGLGAGAAGLGTAVSSGGGAASGAANPGITVTGTKLVPTVADKIATLTPGLGGGLANALTQPPTSPPATANSGTYNPDTNVIEVTANKPPVPPGYGTPIPLTAITNLPPVTPTTASPPTVDVPKVPTEVNSGLSLTDKIRLGLLGAGLISDVAEGSGGSAGRIPGGLDGGLAPVFNAPLPKANMPVATPRTASDMGDVDYYRYGYGPAQSFFTNVPKGAPNTSRAYTGYEDVENFAGGGSTGHGAGAPRTNFAVGGPGDGRDDEIPAMLSDGEYVIDAETVALLGNGSNKAGAEALNKFRVNVRKHKGGKLAKGAFSVAAKRPEQYLKGRK